MLAISLRGMSARKLRTVLTAIAVVLGVALISGTYILTDTINKQFDNIFQTVDKGIDVSVSPKKLFNTDNGTNPPAFDQALVAKAQQVPGVQKAAGGVFDNGTIVGNNGKKVGSGGAPNFVTNPQPEP
ncbi:MAG: ABC transporter permease, partial [Thermoleophilaceae bacterium]